MMSNHTVYYRRMGSMEKHLGTNATSMTLLHQLSDVWSPMGIVLRIEVLTLLVIAISFFLAAFGSICRWSNRWIVQKGFLAAQALSLSLGTYSIGLMQSSSVKSEMFPIWAVSLLTLFGCIDPVTTYNGINYKGLLLKTIFQLCLYCGYVLLLISTISGVVNNLALSLLSVITFIKGFHRSLALVLSSKIRKNIELIHWLKSEEPRALAGDGENLQVHYPTRRYVRVGTRMKEWRQLTSMADIYSSCKTVPSELGLGNTLSSDVVSSIEDVCLGYSLSHLLQRRFLGMDTLKEIKEKREVFESLVRDGKDINYKRTMKAIEVELAFLYEIFFTSNAFLHYHEAIPSSFWALASFAGICFVGVTVSIAGTTGSQNHRSIITGPGASAGAVVVDTTGVDLILTLVILVSLALLQLVQLIRCQASNWARVAFACDYAAGSRALKKSHRQGTGTMVVNMKKCEELLDPRSTSWRLWMRLKLFLVTRMNWFDRYLWQEKLGQYSILDYYLWRSSGESKLLALLGPVLSFTQSDTRDCLCRMLGLHYIGEVIRELWDSDSGTGASVKLHDDVKASIVGFLGHIKSRRMRVEDWSSWFLANGVDFEDLPFSNAPVLRRATATCHDTTVVSEAYVFTLRVMMWHTATCYCELAEQAEAEGEEAASSCRRENNTNRRVAIALSKYCTYLVVSAPELLPGPSAETTRAYKDAMRTTLHALILKHRNLQLGTEDRPNLSTLMASIRQGYDFTGTPHGVCMMGVQLGDCLLNTDYYWELLARLWVQTLVYAAPYGDVQSHMQHLSQGGEFITHLWALLYHLGIDSWETEAPQPVAADSSREAAGAEGEASREEAEIQEND